MIFVIILFSGLNPIGAAVIFINIRRICPKSINLFENSLYSKYEPRAS